MCGWPIAPEPFVGKGILYPLNYFGTFIENQLTMNYTLEKGELYAEYTSVKLLLKQPVDPIHVGLFLESLFYFVDLYVSTSTNTTVLITVFL